MRLRGLGGPPPPREGRTRSPACGRRRPRPGGSARRDHLAVLLDCTAWIGDEALPNPVCRSEVWHKPTDLIIHTRFPADKGQVGDQERWRAPVDAVLNLMLSWHKDGLKSA